MQVHHVVTYLSSKYFFRKNQDAFLGQDYPNTIDFAQKIEFNPGEEIVQSAY